MDPITAKDKPDGCTCRWEDVTSFADTEPMIARTETSPECTVH